MLDKLILSEKDYEYLSKGIASGVSVGIIVGLFIENVPFAFSLGGVMGIISAFIYSYCRKGKPQNESK